MSDQKTEQKWFHFLQNNSGGYFARDENVCEEVFIQAANAAEAIKKAEGFCDNSDSCPCCGDRWSFWVDDCDGTDEPLIYGEPLSAIKPSTLRSEARLHYADGRVETHTFSTEAA